MSAVNDPKGEAGAKKAPMWLLPPVALEQTAWVAKLGAEKYGPYNWRVTGVCATTYVSAIMRHLNAWRDGEDLDPESGISHIAHIATSCNILMDAAACGTLQDDRNKRPAGGLEAHKQTFREILAGMTKEEVLAELESRMPTDDCDLGAPVPGVVSQEALTAADLLEADGRRMLERMGEPIELNSCPWIGLLDKDPFAAAPAPSQIEVGGQLVDLPPVPEGYDRWEDRGKGWDSGCKRVPCFAARFSPLIKCPWQVYHNDTANGVSGSRYLEAVRDTTVRVVDHDIKPGDKVTGKLVRGGCFTGTVANVVDIRGTKLFQFLDRASITEDEIYSITRLA